MQTVMFEWSGAILVTPEYKIIMQQRDDKPDIANPGLVSFFGGAIEPGENKEQALIRELKEEISYTVKKYTFFKTFEKHQKTHGSDWNCHVFVVHDVNPNELVVREGQGLVLVTKDSYIEREDLTSLSRQVLQEFFATYEV